MASQALYLRWRPMNFDEVVGQEHVVHTLRNALASGRIAHAYLFAGLRGTGKTSMARLLAKAVNCPEVGEGDVCPGSGCHVCQAVREGRYLDLIEIDAASHTSVDDVRELRERVAFAPNEGKYKVYIIDEVHRFSGAAFDALLKTIEEPPDHAILILATTEIHKVPRTILSRCQRFDFKRIPLHQIVERLRLIVDHEGIEAEEDALELVARQATGSMRDSISLLDQLLAEPDKVVSLELARAILGTVAVDDVYALTEAVITGDTGHGITLINRVLDEGADAQQFARDMIEYLRMVMLIQTGGADIVEMMAMPAAVEAAAQQAQDLPRRALLAALRAFSEAADQAAGGWQPQLPLEMAFIESVEALHEAQVEAAAPAQRPAAQAAPQPAQAEAPRSPEPPPPAVAEPEPQPAGAPALSDVVKKWDVIREAIKRADLRASALLTDAAPLRIEGRRLILSVPSDFHRGKIETEETRQIIRDVIVRITGFEFAISCQVSAQGGGSNPAADDSLVNYVVNELGGKVIRIEDTEE
ncbi:MAG: DNA polymerase III subunit gamma/tau [Anaerolineae bacterium]